jgi:hypothetical protein
MLPRVPSLPTLACACALLSAACAEPKREPTTPSGQAGGASRSTSGECQPGGPSVDIDIRGKAGGTMPNEELGALLAWIGGFAEPCRKAPAEAPRFTLEIEIGAEGQPPKLLLVEREALPSLEACLDDGFGKAPPPPPGPMMVDIVIPWGCPTLGADFQDRGAETAPTTSPTTAQ